MELSEEEAHLCFKCSCYKQIGPMFEKDLISTRYPCCSDKAHGTSSTESSDCLMVMIFWRQMTSFCYQKFRMWAWCDLANPASLSMCSALFRFTIFTHKAYLLEQGCISCILEDTSSKKPSSNFHLKKSRVNHSQLASRIGVREFLQPAFPSKVAGQTRK